jgi:hypothetical protein
MDEPRMAAVLVAHHHPGFYFSVLEEGEVGQHQSLGTARHQAREGTNHGGPTRCCAQDDLDLRGHILLPAVIDDTFSAEGT